MPAIVKTRHYGRWFCQLTKENPFGFALFISFASWCPGFMLQLGRWAVEIDRMMSDSVDVDWGPEKEFVLTVKD